MDGISTKVEQPNILLNLHYNCTSESKNYYLAICLFSAQPVKNQLLLVLIYSRQDNRDPNYLSLLCINKSRNRIYFKGIRINAVFLFHLLFS